MLIEIHPLFPLQVSCCPVCGQLVRGGNVLLNRHVDECLNQGLILSAIREGSSDGVGGGGGGGGEGGGGGGGGGGEGEGGGTGGEREVDGVAADTQRYSNTTILLILCYWTLYENYFFTCRGRLSLSRVSAATCVSSSTKGSPRKSIKMKRATNNSKHTLDFFFKNSWSPLINVVFLFHHVSPLYCRFQTCIYFFQIDFNSWH